MTDTIIKVDAETFVKDLKGALAVADKDTSLQAICSVHLEVVNEGKTLAVAATDRFTLVALLDAVKDSENVEEGWKVTIPRADAEDVVKAYGTVKRANVTLAMDDEGGVLRLSVPGKSTRFAIRPVEGGAFPPNWRSLLSTPEGVEFLAETASAVVDEDKLAQLRKARRSSSDQLVVEFRTGVDGRCRMVRVILGSYGVGVVMPLKQASGTPLEVLGIR